MAFIFAIGALACAKWCFGSKDSQEATIRQSIANNISISSIANIMTSTGAVTQTNAVINQGIDFTMDKGCTISGNVLIGQYAGLNVTAYNVVASKLDQKAINDITLAIQNQLESAIKQENDALIKIFQNGMSAKQIQDVQNEYNIIMKAQINVNTISKIFANLQANQKLTIVCNAPVAGDYRLNNDAVINLAVMNLVNNIVDQIMDNNVIGKISNDVGATAAQSQSDPFSTFFKSIGTVGMVIIAVIAFLIFAIIGLVVLKLIMGRKKGSSGEPRYIVVQQPYPQQYPQQQMILSPRGY